ncbi:hypothetical protein [Corynebacterium vitaeruminis]|uniref:hypothetical protein n=1 Tax=Corynebacterium vitaeruminis TaxID=38305 RepID=UPI0023F13D6A|nr:hypothetical protein [Corynebacterium vitaeruminis]
MSTSKNVKAPAVEDVTITPTDIENEVNSEQAQHRTFTATVAGEEREIVDHIGDKLPAVAMFLGNKQLAGKYAPILVEQILGEDQLSELLLSGLEIDDLQDVVKAWVNSRQLGN